VCTGISLLKGPHRFLRLIKQEVEEQLCVITAFPHNLDLQIMS
jgi:hypothetical protein